MGGNHQTNDNNNQIQSIQQPTYISSNSLSYQITDSAKKSNNLLKICYSMQLLHPVTQSQGVNRKILRIDQNLGPKRTSKYL